MPDFADPDMYGQNITCDFEQSYCAWKQDRENDDFDWIRNRGQTPSADTGPPGDHTTGAGKWCIIRIDMARMASI